MSPLPNIMAEASVDTTLRMSGYNQENTSLRRENKFSSIWAILSTSFVVGLSGALMPGPLLALTISTVAEHGFWAGPTLILGHAIGEIVTVFALAKGLGKLLQRPALIGAIGLLGGAFLAWMAYGLLTSVSHPPALQPVPGVSAGFGVSTAFAGLVVSVTNPYWILWWATVGTTYVALSFQSKGTAGISVFYAGHELSDVAWYTVVSLAIATGSRFMKPAIYQGLLLVCGIALLGLAVYFVISGVRSFLRGSRAQPPE